MRHLAITGYMVKMMISATKTTNVISIKHYRFSKMAKAFKFAVRNPSQSFPILTILVPVWFTISFTSLFVVVVVVVFYYLFGVFVSFTPKSDHVQP